MLKLGKVSQNSPGTKMELHSFNIHEFAWSAVPVNIEMFLQREPLGTGGFRQAFKATNPTSRFFYSTWIVKKYLEKAVQGINDPGLTVEQHTKRQVQVHLLAKNFYEQLRKKIIQEDVIDEFGTC